MNEGLSAAYHEAGRAIAAYRLNYYAGRITLMPDKYATGDSNCEIGRCNSLKDTEWTIVLFAGFAAQSRYDKDTDEPGSLNNDKKVIALLNIHNEAELNLWKTAKELIDKNWTIVEAIAEKLFVYKTLEENEWPIIIDAFDEGENWEEYFDKMYNRLSIFKFFYLPPTKQSSYC